MKELLQNPIYPTFYFSTVTIPDSPLAVFQLFFTILEMFAEESIRYADQVLEKRKFNVISVEHIKAYPLALPFLWAL